MGQVGARQQVLTPAYPRPACRRRGCGTRWWASPRARAVQRAGPAPPGPGACTSRPARARTRLSGGWGEPDQRGGFAADQSGGGVWARTHLRHAELVQAAVPIGLDWNLSIYGVRCVYGVNVAAWSIWLFCLCLSCPPSSVSTQHLGILLALFACARLNSRHMGAYGPTSLSHRCQTSRTSLHPRCTCLHNVSFCH